MDGTATKPATQPATEPAQQPAEQAAKHRPQQRPEQRRSAIVLRDLSKRYRDVTAVDGLDLEIGRGELFGLLGPNGAGKSTTIGMLCGLIAPTSGTATIAGFDIVREPARVRERIGVCPQEVAVYKHLSGRENLELFGALHGLDRHAARARAAELIAAADFAEAARRRTGRYSGGMLRQLNLMVALVSDPEIVFLDEPTVGMDARARRRTWQTIGALKGEGRTVILTTHYIEEAQALSDRVGILDYGRLIALGAPDTLMHEHDAPDLEAVFLTITGRRIAEGS